MEASATYFRMEQDAWKTYPHDPPLLALAKFSHDEAMRQMHAAKSEAERRKIAAAIFLGFYLDNGRARGTLCAQNGVDITAFVRTFENHHADLHDKALKLVADEGVSEDRLYEMHKDAMLNHLGYEMLYLHDGMLMSLKESCEKLLARSFVFVPLMNFRNVEPWIANEIAK